MGMISSKFQHGFFSVAHLAVVPHGLIAFGVDIVCIQADVGKLPLQALGFDLLKGCFANKVSRLDKQGQMTFIQTHWKL